MKRLFIPFMIVALLCCQAAVATRAEAVCAQVSIEILQEVTLERVAFDAKLVISNSITDKSLDNVRVDVLIKDASGASKDTIFFVRKPELTGISGVDGTGSVPASDRAESHWLIIPSPGAGGEAAAGKEYWVGATLTYTIGGVQEVLPINPARITVKPMPQLVFDYFMPANVLGDNPFTPQVEPPVVYPLAVRVLNDGYGPANKLKIDSAQPKIVDNKDGLLINFKILGATVNDGQVTPSLAVPLGDLPSKKAATAAWQMISTLSGKFIEFKTSFSHASELGGELTSLIRETNAHFLTHMVKVNLPGRDNRLDFLADVNQIGGFIYESEIPTGSTSMADAKTPVTVLVPLTPPPRPTPTAPTVNLTLPTGTDGWVYAKLTDPSQGLLKLLDVVRADGVHLDPNNFWVDQGLDQDFKKTWTLQIVDYRKDTAVTGSYSLVFVQPEADTTPPVTTLTFSGPVTGNGPFSITPQTSLILTSTDNDGGSGVEAMFKKVIGQDSDFVPAYPFTLATAGTYTVQYYSVDRAGNVETARNAMVTVDDGAPVIGSFSASPTTFAPQAPKGVAAARTADLSLTATDAAPTLSVEVQIASGTTFQADKVVRTLKGTVTSGSAAHLSWDGKDAAGKWVASGQYVARARVTDGLDNPADSTAPSHTTTRDTNVTIGEWFVGAAIDAVTAEQLHPRVNGSRVVWQDQRNGVWDIYTKVVDRSAPQSGTSVRVTNGDTDHEQPAVDGNVIVWQEKQGVKSDIYGYRLDTQATIPIATGPGDKIKPAIAGDWVVWQGNAAGNWDIYAYNLTTLENVQITSHERDQVNPAIAGNVVVWEDYRHGLAEIYQYTLDPNPALRQEKRITFNMEQQTEPTMVTNGIAWTDRRNGQQDIYFYDPVRGELRITYGAGDHSQVALGQDLLVYTDFEAGSNDPNLSYRSLSSGAGGRLTSDPNRQEEPAVGDRLVLWQDNRDGRYQIYAAPFETTPVPVDVALQPGFNLVAIGTALKSAYPTAAQLMAQADSLGIERVLSYDPETNSYRETSAANGDFPLIVGNGLVVYAARASTLRLADSGETAAYTLRQGPNQIGILAAPYGFGANDLIRSVGLENIQSIRRFDAATGTWQTAAVRDGGSGPEIVGLNFPIMAGDGLMITMKKQVDQWTP